MTLAGWVGVVVSVAVPLAVVYAIRLSWRCESAEAEYHHAKRKRIEGLIARGETDEALRVMREAQEFEKEMEL